MSYGLGWGQKKILQLNMFPVWRVLLTYFPQTTEKTDLPKLILSQTKLSRSFKTEENKKSPAEPRLCHISWIHIVIYYEFYQVEDLFNIFRRGSRSRSKVLTCHLTLNFKKLIFCLSERLLRHPSSSSRVFRLWLKFYND